MKNAQDFSLPSRLVALLCAFFLMISLLFTCLTVEINLMTGNHQLHYAIAGSDVFLDYAEAKMKALIEELSDKYGFDLPSVQKLLTRDDISQYIRSCVDWWLSIPTKGFNSEIPEWDGTEMIAVIRADEGFASNVPAYDQRITARDRIVYVIEKNLRETVIPIRGDVLAAAFDMLSKRFDPVNLFQWIRWLPVFGMLISFIFAGVIALFYSGKHTSLLNLIGASIGGCSILLLGIQTLFISTNITELIHRSSEALYIQSRVWSHHLLMHMSGMALITGICCILLLKCDKKRQKKDDES